ncbi:MAG: GTP-binding protein [Methanobacteriota archaeon]|nr:MAG: GTP-binding protein [Euryarchaeota archaeon]
MASIDDRIREIEEEIRRTPYNKATQHHIGKLKAKLARLRDEREKRLAGKGSGRRFDVKRCGDSSVGIVGPPSVGKSTLLNRLTEANSEVGEYEFTTINVVPGVLRYKGARIQVLDLPGLIRGASTGRGRGREVLSVIRSCDLLLILLDVFQPEQFGVIEEELYKAGIRLDQKPPDVTIKKSKFGGVRLFSTVNLSHLDQSLVRTVLNEYGIHSAEVLIREDITLDQFIDVVQDNRCYIPSIVVLNKTDLATPSLVEQAKSRFNRRVVAVSAERGTNLEELKEAIYEKLGLIRVYLKPQGGDPDLREPLVVKRDSTVLDVCKALHRDFVEGFRYAQVWGRSVRFSGQIVGPNHVLQDGDIVTIIKRR